MRARSTPPHVPPWTSRERDSVPLGHQNLVPPGSGGTPTLPPRRVPRLHRFARAPFASLAPPSLRSRPLRFARAPFASLAPPSLRSRPLRFARAPFALRRGVQHGDRDDPSHHLFHFHNTSESSHSAACFPYTSPHTSRSPIERDFALLTACRSDHVDRCVCIPYQPCFRCRLAPSRHRVASADGLLCTGLFSHLLAPVSR